MTRFLKTGVLALLLLGVALIASHFFDVGTVPLFAVGALTLEDAHKVKQRCIMANRTPAVQRLLQAMFSHLVGKNERGLQYVPIDQTSNADSVIADVPCRLFALVVKKPTGSTVASWLKGSDHATVASADPDISIPLNEVKEQALVFPDGLLLAIGLTVAAHTSIGGSTDSNDADAPQGFAIIGAP